MKVFTSEVFLLSLFIHLHLPLPVRPGTVSSGVLRGKYRMPCGQICLFLKTTDRHLFDVHLKNFYQSLSYRDTERGGSGRRGGRAVTVCSSIKLTLSIFELFSMISVKDQRYWETWVDFLFYKQNIFKNVVTWVTLSLSLMLIWHPFCWHASLWLGQWDPKDCYVNQQRPILILIVINDLRQSKVAETSSVLQFTEIQTQRKHLWNT